MTIGLFAPLPLAIMIPFMAAQSFAMGEAFGKSFQYGKRKISAMSNDEFNKLTAPKLHEEIQADIRQMIPHMNKSFATMEKFQSEVVNSIIRGIAQTLGNLGAPSPNTTTDTSTSATNINFSGGLFNLPSASELAKSGQELDFDQWQQTQDAIDKQIEDLLTFKQQSKPKTETKKHKHTIAHHFTPTTRVKTPVKQLTGFGVSKSADAIKKAAMLNNHKFNIQSYVFWDNATLQDFYKVL